jgi:hypothetical protein
MPHSPIVGTIVVTQHMPQGILAKVNGQIQVFPNLQGVFRAAVQHLDREHGHTTPERKEPNAPTTAPPGHSPRSENV